ncbi:MAG: REP-associated tyrosine transposase [Thermodesulfobacteriota bacterium]
MPNYRRAREGRAYFFTVVTYRRQPILCLPESRNLLREILFKVRGSHPFIVEAWVLLPDHMHCIWRLPQGDMNYSLRWGLIKAEFTKGSKVWLARPKTKTVGNAHPTGLSQERSMKKSCRISILWRRLLLPACEEPGRPRFSIWSLTR